LLRKYQLTLMLDMPEGIRQMPLANQLDDGFEVFLIGTVEGESEN